MVTACAGIAEAIRKMPSFTVGEKQIHVDWEGSSLRKIGGSGRGAKSVEAPDTDVTLLRKVVEALLLPNLEILLKLSLESQTAYNQI